MAYARARTGPPRRPRGFTLPIDTERETWWALVEFLYCVQRDARRRWRTRSRGWWRIVRWTVGGTATSAAGMVADHNFHLLVRLLQGLGQT